MLTKRFFAALAGLFVMGAAVAGDLSKAEQDARAAYLKEVQAVADAKDAKALEAAVATLVKNAGFQKVAEINKALEEFKKLDAANQDAAAIAVVADVLGADEAAKLANYKYVAPTSWTDKVVSAVDYLPSKFVSSLNHKLVRGGVVYGTLLGVLYVAFGDVIKNAVLSDEEAVDEEPAVVAAPAA